MKKTLVLAVAALLALTACTTTDPYTREQKTSTATKGAVGGALGGAALGALIGGATGMGAGKGAAIGAGLGTLTGAGVGYYMDQQQQKLLARLEGTGVSVTRNGDNIILNMPGNVTFPTNSADINASFYPVLDDVALVLNEFEKTLVTVDGHTDSDGSESYNLDLSQRRANSVGQYMVSRQVIPQRLVVRGFGESQPIADNNSDFGKQQNRRVVIQISPLTA